MVDVGARRALLASEIHVSRFQFFSGHISAVVKTQVNIWDTEWGESENVRETELTEREQTKGDLPKCEMAVSPKRLERLRNG